MRGEDAITAEADQIAGVRHPRRTSVLIGQTDVERDLLDAYRAERLPHAIMFGGQTGIGKSTLAWRLARFLFCHPTPQSPAVADARDLSIDPRSKVTLQIEALAHPDLVLLRREVNEKTKRFFTDIRADDVRRAIGLFQRAAGAGGYRICIVDSADDLNRSSANALLKLIEEPPPRSLFVIVAHRPGLVLPTIRSRSRLFRLRSLDEDEIVRIVESLDEPFSVLPKADVANAAAHARGSVHDALRLLGHEGLELDRMVGQLLDRLPAVDWREVHRLADRVAGRDGETAYATAVNSIFDWLARIVRGKDAAAPRRLVPYAEVWEKVAAAVREADALNLDKRHLILSLFSELAAAVRSSSA